jgi:beta-lactamase superfamily II metal-dependent hydrolase
MTPPALTNIDFWDVGQADSTTLNFSDDSVLLIDVGLRGSPIVDWLADHPRRIRGIVLTHNDSDHAGALCSLVDVHKQQIEGIYMLQDRPKNDPKFQTLFRCALEGERLGFYQIQWANAGTVVWQSPDSRERVIIAFLSISKLRLPTRSLPW